MYGPNRDLGWYLGRAFVILLVDILSLAGFLYFSRIPFVIQSLYASGQWLTAAPMREPKPWENISLT